MRRLKRAVIKEEFVALTGDVIEALILNQFLYWSDRINDIDQWIREENARRAAEDRDEIELNHGWIYKSAAQLNEELMLGMSEVTIRRKIKHLVEKGFIQERKSPSRSWDRTLQYRVNLQRIRKALNEIGYELQGFHFLDKTNNSRMKARKSKAARGKMLDEELKKWVAERVENLEIDLKRIGFSKNELQKLFERFPLYRIVGFLAQMRKNETGIKRPRSYLLSCLRKKATPDVDWIDIMEVWLPAQFDSPSAAYFRAHPKEFFAQVSKWIGGEDV